MTYIEYIQKLEYIRFLVERKATGTPGTLADKLEVSERTLRRMIKHLKDQNTDIKYCRFSQSYVFES